MVRAISVWSARKSRISAYLKNPWSIGTVEQMARVVDNNKQGSWRLKVMSWLVDGNDGHCYGPLLRRLGGGMRGTY